MKRQSSLFQPISSRPNLAFAAYAAAKGKRHRPEVRQFFSGYQIRLAEMGDSIRQQRYTFSNYREFPIKDPKSRVIHAPVFTDRVVHHAIIRITGPVFERGALEQSFACRPRKGLHAALSKAVQWTCTNDWFFKADVRKFYDSVCHIVIRNALRRRFREEKLLQLFDSLLASYQTEKDHGLPIGALTSQYLGNFYLDSVDRWAKQTMFVKRYMRYMDDMLCIGSKNELMAIQRELQSFVQTIGLSIAGQGQLNRCELGIPWLGFTIYPDRVRLNPQGRRRLRRRMKQAERNYQRGSITEHELQHLVASFFAHAQFSDDVQWRRGVCANTLLGGITGTA